MISLRVVNESIYDIELKLKEKTQKKNKSDKGNHQMSSTRIHTHTNGKFFFNFIKKVYLYQMLFSRLVNKKKKRFEKRSLSKRPIKKRKSKTYV